MSLHGSGIPGALGSNTAQGGPIARILGADMTLTTDQALTMLVVPAKYVIRRIVAERASGAYGTACLGGIYTAASKGGSAIVAATQSYVLLSGANTAVDMTLAALAAATIITSAQLYLALSTGNTGAFTANIYVWGEIIS